MILKTTGLQVLRGEKHKSQTNTILEDAFFPENIPENIDGVQTYLLRIKKLTKAYSRYFDHFDQVLNIDISNQS